MTSVDDLFTLTGTYTVDLSRSRVVAMSRSSASPEPARSIFEVVDGSVFFDVERPENSYVSVSLTPAAARLGRARSDISFVSDAVDQVGPSTYRVDGVLMIGPDRLRLAVEADRSHWAVEAGGEGVVGFEGHGVVDFARRADGTRTGSSPLADLVLVTFELVVGRAPRALAA